MITRISWYYKFFLSPSKEINLIINVHHNISMNRAEIENLESEEIKKAV